MDLGIRGRVALITGGAGGIGQETARLLLGEGASVILADLASPRLETAAASLGAAERVTTLELNVTDEKGVERAIEQGVAWRGRIDVLVNSAGIYRIGQIAEVDPAAWDQMIDINLRGTYLTCRAVLPGMIERKAGSIVNLSSISGRTKSFLATPSYVASKAGVIGLTMALASQNAGHGVRVNAVAPGPIDTDMIRGLPDELKPGLVANIPMGRLGTASEVARAIVFLASDAAAFITGETLSVNGGAFMV